MIYAWSMALLCHLALGKGWCIVVKGSLDGTEFSTWTGGLYITPLIIQIFAQGKTHANLNQSFVVKIWLKNFLKMDKQYALQLEHETRKQIINCLHFHFMMFHCNTWSKLMTWIWESEQQNQLLLTAITIFLQQSLLYRYNSPPHVGRAHSKSAECIIKLH